MKRTVCLTQAIYPRYSGGQIGVYGDCEAIGKITRLTVFSLLGDDIEKDTAYRGSRSPYFETRLLYRRGDRRFIKKISYCPMSLVISRLLFVQPVLRDYYEAVAKYIKEKKAEIVFFEQLPMYPYFRKLKREFPNLIYIYRSHNVEYLNAPNEYFSGVKADARPINALKRLYAAVLCKLRKRMEKDFIARADYCFCMSENDRQIFIREKFAPPERIIFQKIMPSFERVKTPESVVSFHHRLLFVGSMNWFPNVNGLKWFVREVFSVLLKKNAAYTLCVVGHNPAAEMRAICDEYSGAIEITGYVPSVAEYYRQCDICVVPLFEGTGVKLKVLEAMGSGIPTVCSRFAAREYAIGDELALATTAEEFIAQIEALAASSVLRHAYCERMRRYCESYYSLEDQVKSIFS